MFTLHASFLVYPRTSSPWLELARACAVLYATYWMRNRSSYFMRAGTEARRVRRQQQLTSLLALLRARENDTIIMMYVWYLYYY